MRTYGRTWQGRSPAEGMVGAAMVSYSCTQDFSSGALASQGLERWDHTADVIHSGAREGSEEKAMGCRRAGLRQ